MTLHTRPEDGAVLPYLVWRFLGPLLVASTASSGGGVGTRSWIINAQVSHDYARHDLDAHAAELAAGVRLAGAGVAMFTAADVTRVRRATDGGVSAEATVGLTHPTWAAAAESGSPTGVDSVPPAAGTINIVAFLPVNLTSAALLGALCTATEAKTQALLERGIPGTGTPSDAVTVVCPAEGSEPFCGVRSEWGARLARAVHAAVSLGT
ncbi:adenosylcobinamide amidohydrolase [Jatrophihabitans sp.]|uniref:adenosylcobinamide amidohydrolase n=1 Tax=Jatrophihabitans sp. TaxID=1932789 RepID=UPI002D0E3BED|nr:adenosylcobinamide amidohydrolase [Jatrophihabitans sp.]